MKTKILVAVAASVVALVVGGRSLFAGDSPQASRASTLLPPIPAPACCAPVVAKPACCAIDEVAADEAAVMPVGASAASSEGKALSDRSIYQLDAGWTDDAGKARTLASLRGRPVVLTMFFASCGYACPVLVSDMQRLRELLPAAVRAETRFVLVSFDTARDTPEVLRAFRERSSLDDGWVILRGEEAPVQELAMLLGVKFKRDANGQFSHSNLITILNVEGEMTYQRNGLMGDVSETARAVALAVR